MTELQAHLKKLEQSVRFKLQPKTTSTTVTFTVNDDLKQKQTAKCRMTQIPVILADAITGHKMQGMTLDNVIVPS